MPEPGGRQIDVLDVVHHVHVRNGVGVPREIKIVARRNVVAEEDLAGVEVGDDQVQVVDQLDAGDGIAGRVGPDQRDAQGLVLGRAATAETYRVWLWPVASALVGS